MKIVADDEFNDCATALALALAFTRSDLLSSSLRSFLRSESEGFKFVVCREDAGRDQFSREAFTIFVQIFIANRSSRPRNGKIDKHRCIKERW